MDSSSRSRWLTGLVLNAFALALIVGCGSNAFPVRAARGTVVCDGQPVTRGSITFTPIGGAEALETGKAASAVLKEDGSFQLSTFGRFDGAIIGKHRVEFTGSEGEEDEESNDDDSTSTRSPKTKPNQRQACILAQELILEVKANGDNVFKIELTKSK